MDKRNITFWRKHKIAEYRRDTEALSPEEIVALESLKDHYWQNDNSLPNDLERLVRITKLTPRKRNIVQGLLNRHFPCGEDDSRRNQELDDEKMEVLNSSRDNAKIAKIAAAERWRQERERKAEAARILTEKDALGNASRNPSANASGNASRNPLANASAMHQGGKSKKKEKDEEIKAAAAKDDAAAAKPDEDDRVLADRDGIILAELVGIGPISATVVPQIIHNCVTAKPDVTIEEIIWATREAVRLAKQKGRDRVAFVIGTVDGICSGTGFKEEQAAEQAARTEEAARAFRSAFSWDQIIPEAGQLAATMWSCILAYLEKKVIRQSFETWLKPAKALDVRERTLYVLVPSPEFQHIGVKYGDFIQAAIEDQNLALDDLCCLVDPTDWPGEFAGDLVTQLTDSPVNPVSHTRTRERSIYDAPLHPSLAEAGRVQ